MTAVHSHPPATEADPATGCASVSVGGQSIFLSEGEWWVEPDGDYVIRSLEFDVLSAGSTFAEALGRFIDDLYDFAVYLGTIESPGENEEEMFHRLTPRLLEVSRQLQRTMEAPEKRPIIEVNLPRRRRSREDVREWHPSSRQPGSRPRSPA